MWGLVLKHEQMLPRGSALTETRNRMDAIRGSSFGTCQGTLVVGVCGIYTDRVDTYQIITEKKTRMNLREGCRCQSRQVDEGQLKLVSLVASPRTVTA